MVTHVAYRQEQFKRPEECLAAIRTSVELGWQVSEIRGSGRGPFVVVFRMDGP